MAPFRKIFNSTKPGSLHKALGVRPGVVIPVAKLKQAMKWTGSPRKRALAAKAAVTYRFYLKRHGR